MFRLLRGGSENFLLASKWLVPVRPLFFMFKGLNSRQMLKFKLSLFKQLWQSTFHEKPSICICFKFCSRWSNVADVKDILLHLFILNTAPCCLLIWLTLEGNLLLLTCIFLFQPSFFIKNHTYSDVYIIDTFIMWHYKNLNSSLRKSEGF